MLLLSASTRTFRHIFSRGVASGWRGGHNVQGPRGTKGPPTEMIPLAWGPHCSLSMPPPPPPPRVSFYACDLRIFIKGRKEMLCLTTHSTHMVKDHSDSERGIPLPPHGLLFPISSKGSFISIIPQTE